MPLDNTVTVFSLINFIIILNIIRLWLVAAVITRDSESDIETSDGDSVTGSSSEKDASDGYDRTQVKHLVKRSSKRTDLHESTDEDDEGEIEEGYSADNEDVIQATNQIIRTVSFRIRLKQKRNKKRIKLFISKMIPLTKEQRLALIDKQLDLVLEGQRRIVKVKRQEEKAWSEVSKLQSKLDQFNKSEEKGHEGIDDIKARIARLQQKQEVMGKKYEGTEENYIEVIKAQIKRLQNKKAEMDSQLATVEKKERQCCWPFRYKPRRKKKKIHKALKECNGEISLNELRLSIIIKEQEAKIAKHRERQINTTKECDTEISLHDLRLIIYKQEVNIAMQGKLITELQMKEAARIYENAKDAVEEEVDDLHEEQKEVYDLRTAYRFALAWSKRRADLRNK